MPVSPYQDLPARNYWRSGVVDRHPLAPGDVYRKKYSITGRDRIATAGSCFAQHIARHLRHNGIKVIDEEPAPQGLSEDIARSFGFGLYSARYGNIYTTRQLLQLIEETLGIWQPAMPVWTKNGRYYDALRPSVEPEGHESAEDVAAHRSEHLKAVRRVLEEATVFVFTLGLTETWIHTASGTTYPTAPGTIAGSHDPEVFSFKNFSYGEVVADFLKIRQHLKTFNPRMRFLLTVSPVPLTATASDQHVLVATTYSKAVLRAAAGHLATTRNDIDYFPSFEIISGIPARGFFYENNLRSVSNEGVEVVMRTFFAEHAPIGNKAAVAPVERSQQGQRPPTDREREELEAREEEVVCEEELLEAFGR